jgi:tetratricopeptide (TPR) repeat protein
MPVQHGPGAPVNWPVQSGPVPPVAAFYTARPESGFWSMPGQAPDQSGPLVRATEAGSYLLTGPGGTGKTQLAAAYAHALWQSGEVELLVWITASSRAAILVGYAQAFLQVSRAPGGPSAQAATTPADPSPAGPAPAGAPGAPPEYGTGEDMAELAGRFLRWLPDSTRSWLIVLDDLADATDMTELWPRGAMGRTIVTTRLLPAAVSPPQHASLVQVGTFSRREALSFLTTRLVEDTAQRNGALDLAEDLDCLPIALGQAAAVIADCHIDCLDYRRQYAERRQAMGIGQDAGHAGTVAVTWSLSLDRADQLLPPALARPVLAMLAMLDANGVPAAVLTSNAAREYVGSYSAGRAAATDLQVLGTLSGLAQAGLLAAEPGSAARTVCMHAMMQACIRQVLPASVRDQAAAAASAAILEAWPEHGPDPDLDQALRDNAAALAAAVGEALWEGTQDQPLLLRAGRSLDEARLSESAIAYWRALADASTKAQGPGGAQALQYLRRLAAAYEAAGQGGLALEVLTQSLTHLEETLGPSHADTLTARAELGRACLAAGLLAHAGDHFERTLAGREWVLGPDHPDTLAARGDLASVYRAEGRLDEAITGYRRTLTDQELVLGEDNAITAATRGDLAATLHAAGRMRDALPLYARTLADRERLLGPDHPDTLTARGNLAYAYRLVGKLKDAIPLYSRTLADRERVLGPDHPDTLTSRGNLAAAYFSARKLKDAIPLYERTVADRERVQGPDHPDTLTARGNLASAYHSAGRLVVATELYERTALDYERVLGPRHENTLTSRANLALAYYEARRMTDAIALFRHTLSDCEQALPPDHPLTRSVRESLQAATRG